MAIVKGGERMAPQDNNERIAVVEKVAENIEKGMSRLEQKLDSLIDNIEKKFVPRQEFDSLKEHYSERIEDLQDEIKGMKDRNNKVIGGIVTAIVTLSAAVINGMHIFK
jgi:chaperonin cofactor prefoldin